MPEEGLPTSISFLSVKVSIAEKSVVREKGEDRSKIAHVPAIKIDELGDLNTKRLISTGTPAVQYTQPLLRYTAIC